MVKVGDTFTIKGVTVEIREVLPYTSFWNLKQLMVGYVIKDRGYISPTAHFWMNANDDIRPQIERIVDYYMQVKDSILRGTT
jgi:hypothetical protein